MSERAWAVAELVIAGALFLSLLRLVIPADKANPIARFLKQLFFGGNN